MHCAIECLGEHDNSHNTNDVDPARCVRHSLSANDGDTIDFAVTGAIGPTGGELAVDKGVRISGPGGRFTYSKHGSAVRPRLPCHAELLGNNERYND
jgi:hypothetical protein